MQSVDLKFFICQHHIANWWPNVWESMEYNWQSIRDFSVWRNFPLLKGYCLKPKFCPKVYNKPFHHVLVTVYQHAIIQERMCNYFIKLWEKVCINYWIFSNSFQSKLKIVFGSISYDTNLSKYIWLFWEIGPNMKVILADFPKKLCDHMLQESDSIAP